MHAARCLLILLLLLPPGPTAGQALGTLTGVVTGADAVPLALARIRVLGSELVVLTRTDGRFEVAGVSPGSRSLEVRMLGYARVLVPVVVVAGETLHVPVTLAIEAVPLKAVEIEGAAVAAISPALRGFEERRARGTGHFFTRQEIARMQPRVFTDVLRRVPGVRLVPATRAYGNDDIVRMERSTGITGARACPVLFYVNGTPFPVTGDLPINLYIAPEDIVAIEIYSGTSSIPPEFHSSMHNARCGVIVIWTRIGDKGEEPSR